MLIITSQPVSTSSSISSLYYSNYYLSLKPAPLQPSACSYTFQIRQKLKSQEKVFKEHDSRGSGELGRKRYSDKLSCLHSSGVKTKELSSYTHAKDKAVLICSSDRVPASVLTLRATVVHSTRHCEPELGQTEQSLLTWGYGGKIIPCRQALIGSDRIVASWLMAERMQDFPDPH